MNHVFHCLFFLTLHFVLLLFRVYNCANHLVHDMKLFSRGEHSLISLYMVFILLISLPVREVNHLTKMSQMCFSFNSDLPLPCTHFGLSLSLAQSSSAVNLSHSRSNGKMEIYSKLSVIETYVYTFLCSPVLSLFLITAFGSTDCPTTVLMLHS